MSLVREAAKHIRGLEPEDWRVLRAFASGLPTCYSLAPEDVATRARLHARGTGFRLRKLHRLRFIQRDRARYRLNSAGLDALALNRFAQRYDIEAIGQPLGLGKEADVFEALGSGATTRAIKFFRLGRISFRAARRKRGYASPLEQPQWLYLNIQAAHREFSALRRLAPLNLAVPKPIAREFHALLLPYLDGLILPQVRELPEPELHLAEVLGVLRRSYLEAQLVNADLSEYNLVYDGERIWVIDWPQAVPASHPNAPELLKRDLANIVSYFARRFQLPLEEDRAFAYVQGLAPTYA